MMNTTSWRKRNKEDGAEDRNIVSELPGKEEEEERTEDGAAGLDGVLALPDHGDDGACDPNYVSSDRSPYERTARTAGHVLDKSGEEALRLEVGVVELEVLNSGVDHLEGHELVSALLEAGDDLAGESCESEVEGQVGSEEEEGRGEPRWTPSGLRRGGQLVLTE